MRHKPLDYESGRPPKTARCPFCQSAAVVTGKLTGGDSSAVGFVPDGMKTFAFTFLPPGVRADERASACAGCGAVWSRTDTAKLREVLARWMKDGVAQSNAMGRPYVKRFGNLVVGQHRTDY